MDSTLSEAVKEAYASAPSDEVILFTMEMRHRAFTEPLRVVRDTKDLEAMLEDEAPENAGEVVRFAAYAFDLQLPEIDEYGKPELVITIDNVGREIMNYLEAAVRTPYKIEVTYRIFLASSPMDGPQNLPTMTMVINSVECTVNQITARAGFTDLSKVNFPKLKYTLEQFPSLQTAS